MPSSLMAIVDDPDAKSLAFYKKADKLYGQNFLVAALIELNDQLNISGKMNESQIISAARILDQKYFFFTPDDFRLAFIDGITGKYGKIFNRLDIEVLCGWLEEYNMARTEYASNRHIQYKEPYDARVGKINNEEAYKQVFSENYNNLKNKKA